MNTVDPIWIQIIGMMIIMVSAAGYVVFWDRRDSQKKSSKKHAIS